ncbi:HAD family hydrolase [Alphaproteobacteria bacterium]|nr:HAD family hydrolase [Alphaproteobacteria bacterium]MDC1085890.1 HAD-IA family hydrolase [Alphaproteobacteria bacterium]
MSKIKHISFDLDGTLIDSLPIMKVAWESSMVALNHNCHFSEYKKHIGLPFPRILELLHLSSFEKDLSKLYFSHTKRLAGDVKTFYGVDDVFNWVSKIGISTSIITSKPRENAEFLCDKLNITADLLVCGDDHRNGKPNAFVADKVLKNFDVLPSEVLYVGDMVVDFQFALNTGMRFIFFNGNGLNRIPDNIVNEIDTISCLTDLMSWPHS